MRAPRKGSCQVTSLCNSKPLQYTNFFPGNFFISTWKSATGFCYYVIVLQWSKSHLPNHHCSKRKIFNWKFLFSTVLCQGLYQLVLHTYGMDRLERNQRNWGIWTRNLSPGRKLLRNFICTAYRTMLKSYTDDGDKHCDFETSKWLTKRKKLIQRDLSWDLCLDMDFYLKITIPTTEE